MMKLSVIKKILFDILLVLIILLVFFEIFTRIFITSPSRQIYDAELGWVYMPNVDILHGKEGWSRNRLNSLGLNDTEISNTLDQENIIILGDSFTEALNVEQDKNFVNLADKSFEKINLINAGRSAISPLQMPVIVMRIKRDLHINKMIMVISSDDIKDIQNQVNSSHIIYDSNNNILQVKVESPHKDKLKSKLEPVLHNSALVTYLMRRYKKDILSLWSKIKTLNFGRNDYMDVPHENNAIDKRQLIKYIMQQQSTMAPASILFLPKIDHKIDRVTEEKLSSRESKAFFKSLACELDIPFLDATPYLMEVYRKRGQPPFGFDNYQIGIGHLNELGHEAVAKALIDLIELQNLTACI